MTTSFYANSSNAIKKAFPILTHHIVCWMVVGLGWKNLLSNHYENNKISLTYIHFSPFSKSYIFFNLIKKSFWFHYYNDDIIQCSSIITHSPFWIIHFNYCLLGLNGLSSSSSSHVVPISKLLTSSYLSQNDVEMIFMLSSMLANPFSVCCLLMILHWIFGKFYTFFYDFESL